MAIYYPPIFINAYLQEKIREEFNTQFRLQNPDTLDDASLPNTTIPFFPTSPTAIEDLTQTLPMGADNVFSVYDRMFKMRRSPFPHIKSEQLLYYFYKTAGDPEQLIETTQIVQDLLDREDESAQDLNDWIAEYALNNPGQPVPLLDKSGNQVVDYYYNDNPELPVYKTIKTANILGKDFLLPYFHKIKIYQLEETRDIIDFGTARTYAGNKIIIDYDWHKSE